MGPESVRWSVGGNRAESAERRGQASPPGGDSGARGLGTGSVSLQAHQRTGFDAVRNRKPPTREATASLRLSGI